MLLFKRLTLKMLQLFAGEGAGEGDGGSSGEAAGVEAADPGRQRLMELGVPQSKLRKNRSYSFAAPKNEAPVQEAQQEQQEQRDDSAEESKPTEGEAPKEAAKPKLNWEDVKADPDINAKLQEMMTARHKDYERISKALKALTPALEVLSRKHGIDASKGFNYEAIAKAVDDDDQYYEDRAARMGVDLDVAKEADQQERQQKRQMQQEQDELARQQMENHFARMEAQAEALKKTFPQFSLQQELNNPVFSRMVHPAVGLSVEDAYYAVHRAEIQQASMQVAAQKTAEKMSAAIASGSRRPVEGGSKSQAPSVVSFDYRNATREQRAALRARIMRGERIYPGQEF